eukprot:jgi/Bigna1/130925/aug1.12_g5633
MMQRARTTGQYLFTEALNPNNTFDPTKNTERMSEVIPEFAPEKRREMSEKEIRKARELAAENYLNSSRKGEEVIQRSITDLDNTPIMDGVVAQRKKDLFEITTNLSKAILREVLPNITNIKIPPRVDITSALKLPFIINGNIDDDDDDDGGGGDNSCAGKGGGGGGGAHSERHHMYTIYCGFFTISTYYSKNI